MVDVMSRIKIFLGCGLDAPFCLWCTYSLLNELPTGADWMFPWQTRYAVMIVKRRSS